MMHWKKEDKKTEQFEINRQKEKQRLVLEEQRRTDIWIENKAIKRQSGFQSIEEYRKRKKEKLSLKEWIKQNGEWREWKEVERKKNGDQNNGVITFCQK